MPHPIHIPLPDGRIAYITIEIREALDGSPLDVIPAPREATLAEGIEIIRRLPRTVIAEISNPSDLTS